MRLLSLIALIAGVVASVVLVAALDRAAIATSIAAVGWGFAVVCLYRLIPVACETSGWTCLIPRQQSPRYSRLFLYRWISKSINTLLPAMQVGGDLVRARLLVYGGVAAEAAAASVLVDVTVWLAAQIAFILLGIVVLVALGTDDGGIGPIVASFAIGAGLIAAFIAAQRFGMLRMIATILRRIAGATSAARLAAALQMMDRSVVELYRSTCALALATFWHFAGWLLRTLDTWLTLYFMGVAIGMREAIVLESLSIAIRSAAFMVPAGVGAQEVAIVAIGTQLGLSPATALALALIKRGQELVVFTPGLLAWLFVMRHSQTSTAGGLTGPHARTGNLPDLEFERPASFDGAKERG